MVFPSISQAKPGGFASRAHHHSRGGWWSFLGHFAQMLVAMVAGMAGLGVLLGASSRLDHAYTAAPAEFQALIMAVSMTVPMVAWMRFRHHSLQASAEMAAAMLLPSAALFPLLWSGVASADTVLVLEHIAMPLAMIGAMLLRRGEYGL